VQAELSGFRTAQQTGFELNADSRLTANFKLEVGGVAETVDVVAVTGEKVNTTSGEIARTIDGSQVREVALNGRNYLQLASLIPGAVVTNNDQLDLATSLSVTGQSINGNRGESNSLSIDGGNNLDSGSNGSQVNNIGIDFIDEVKIQTSNFSAEYGRNSGASINVVTRSGKNTYNGSIFEFFRHDSLDAANHFSPRDASGNQIKAKLRFNDFGGALGGPIVRDKFFFFGGQEYKYIRRQTSPARFTLPTRAELGGNFSGRSVVINDPRTGQPFPGNIIPSDRITADGRALANTYLAMIDESAAFDDRPVGNNATYQLDNPFDYRQDIIRLDYRFNDQHSVYGRYIHDKYDLIEPLGTFSGSNLPTTPTNRLRPGNSYQVSYTWVATKNIVNATKANASWNGQRIPPVGDNWERSTHGYQYPQLYEGGRIPDGIPNVDLSGFANFRGPHFSLLSPTTDIAIDNTTTWIAGDHQLKGGVKYIRNRKDQNGRPTYLGALNFNAAGNTQTTGFSVADMLLGNFRTYSEASDDPVGFFRFNQYEAFVSDNWRVNNRLSLELGVRYQFAPPIYSQQNNLVNFDPALYDPARAVRMNNNGTIVPNSGFRFNGLVRAGDGIPEDQTGRVDLVTGGDYDLIPTGAPRGLYDAEHLFMPRVSGAYSIGDDGRTSVRGGIGLFYDRPQGNVVYSSVNLPPILQISQYENGNLGNPSGGTPSALAPLAGIQTIDPNLSTASQLQYSVSVQREVMDGYLFEVAYVGNKGRDQLWFPDINRVPFEVLALNNALPAAQRLSENALRPYKGYSAIQQRRSEAQSNYNGLQLYFNKRRGDFTFTVGYTLSKVETDASGFGDNPTDNELAYNYGPASYDRRHVFVSTWTYRLPFLRDRRDILGFVLGGWEASGITRAQSGQYLTATGNTSIGARRADYVEGQDIAIDDGDENRWFNTAAFVAAPNTRRGTATVGQIQGPAYYVWDVSFRKKFSVTQDVKVGVQADIFNLFNRVNLGNPNTVTTDGNYGRINATAGPARQMQIGVRLEF
jgi:outer membrane receptor protein involved in Fe transport